MEVTFDTGFTVYYNIKILHKAINHYAHVTIISVYLVHVGIFTISISSESHNSVCTLVWILRSVYCSSPYEWISIYMYSGWMWFELNIKKEDKEKDIQINKIKI